MSESIRDAVRAFVLQGLQEQGTDTLDDDASLPDLGYLDSLSIFQLVAFVESRFAIRVADEDIGFENFGSVRAIERFVASRAAGRSPVTGRP